jgi:hypothetical protein
MLLKDKIFCTIVRRSSFRLFGPYNKRIAPAWCVPTLAQHFDTFTLISASSVQTYDPAQKSRRATLILLHPTLYGARENYVQQYM